MSYYRGVLALIYGYVTERRTHALPTLIQGKQMKFKNKIQVVTLFLTLVFASPNFAKSPVFKISKGDEQVYIGGTIHLLSPDDYPLPKAFQQAFDASEHVYFEADLEQFSLPEVQAKMTASMALPEGQSLKTTLNEETYAQLEAFLTERNIPIAAFDQLSPAAVSLSLTVIETLDEQIGFISEINEAEPNLVISSSLESLVDLNSNWEKGLSAWREGDLEAMGASLGAEEMKADFPGIFKVLLTDRNERWLVEIKEMFNSEEVELVLVGALHLTDDDGLIEQLKEDGYTVEQLD